MKAVMVIAAHTDDEAIGCGGTIARHVAAGDAVHVVFMADGVTSRAQADTAGLQQRHAAAEQAHAVLGIAGAHHLGFPDNRLDSVALLDVVQPLEQIIRAVRPEIVYTHHSGDLNVDHQITHQAVMTACRPQPGFPVREILAFEVMSSTEWTGCAQLPFVPDVFIDIDAFWERKRKALEAYALEMRDFPHSRSIEHMDILARHRGACVGVARAEAFKLIRSLR
ncbi:PIG-L family deacetylase [Massilia solisilvae]|uniref:PIG-L family deacetylase n=1 Tax=Massilia solisilvae TaxID=1811225 RepID=A0ABT2BEQ0_9BURK|nr:PIG-L deacetylase family protein [Massilia solisilvae]MCS0606989.1 PIG-L family deacetylase [Massilia solisilvae]